jgi:uncharacterized protein YeaO (DUF488 family)
MLSCDWSYVNLRARGKRRRRMLKLKRIYEPAAAGDGFRILVDRVWPRGVSKSAAHLDLWMKEIAPSNALRKWFAHDPARWSEFQRRYRSELRAQPELTRELKRLLKEHPTTTLLFGARDEEHNQAVALRAFLSPRK